MRTSLAVVASILLVATYAHAEPSAHDRAAESFQQARAAFARREFTAAAAAFEQAAGYEAHPVAWLNAAEAWAKADEPTKAATDCDRVLDDPASTAVHRDEAEARLKVLGKHVATLQIAGKPGSRASLDGAASFALPARRRTTAGTHVVTLVDVPSQRIEITAHLGEIVEVETRVAPATAPAAAPAAPAAPADAETSPQRTGGRTIPTATWLAFGGAAVAAGATTFFALRTASAATDFTAFPSEKTRDGFYRERLVTNLSLAVAVVAVGVGVAFWLLSPTDRPRGMHATFQGFTFAP